MRAGKASRRPRPEAHPSRGGTRHSRCSPRPTCWSSAAGRPGPRRRSRPGRLGAEVMLVERYNHLGGLSTGGLVIWIDRMSDWSGKQVIAGFARDLFDRLPKDGGDGAGARRLGLRRTLATAAYWKQRAAAYKGIVTWSPTIDPEALKTLSMRMVLEQRVRLTVFHSWAVAPIVEDGAMRGRDLREQGRASGDVGQGSGRHYRRCRPARARRARFRVRRRRDATSTIASTPPS